MSALWGLPVVDTHRQATIPLTVPNVRATSGGVGVDAHSRRARP
jgi:hypothetical protein